MKNVKVTKPKKGEQNVIVYDLTLSSPDRNSKDIGSLKSAILRAESITLPNRHLLYDLYHDVKSIDGHLSGIIRKRIDAVLNKNLKFVNKDKQQIDALEPLIESNKFNKLIELIIETKLWGCSGVEFIIGEKFDWVEVPRKHIRPEASVISKSQYSNTGIPIDDLPFVWVMGEKKDLGQLLQCSMYALYKRNGFGDYAQYVEIFGQPVRIIKYDANDTATKNELDKVLAESGSSLAMKIPRQADFEMLDGKASNANGDLQTKLISVCNSEMSIAILGNTETTTSSSSSGYAQSKEHSKQQLEITKSDLRYVQNMLNSDFFIQMLKWYGYPVEGGRFEYEMELDLDSLKTKLEIDDRVSAKVPVADDYWYATYGIPKPDNYNELKAEQKIKLEADAKARAEILAQANQPPEPKPEPKPKEKDIKLKNKNKLADLLDLFFLDTISLNDYYAKTCGCSTHLCDLADSSVWNSIYESIARDLLADKLAHGQIHPDLYNQTANSLLVAVDAGLGGTSFNYDDSRNILKSYLTRNIYQFSAAKSLTEQLEFRNMMYDKKTKELLSYNEFLKRVKAKGKLFNENYLETEYTTAKQSAIMAHKWDSIDAEYLEFSTIGDGQVRASHQKLDGMTYPKNHQIWNKLYPPIEWNCRCTVIPGIASKYKESNAQADEKVVGGMVKNTIFDNNVGTSKVIFEKGHPYFKKGVKDLSWKAYGLEPLAKAQARSGKVPALKFNSAQEFEDFYDKMVNTKDGITLTDATGTAVLFPKSFKNHIITRKKDLLRYEFAGNAFETVSNPNEVWSVLKKNAPKPLTTHYIKYYTNKTILVLVENNIVTTAFVLDKTGFKTRMGVLLHKK
ncbi:MAG: DUF935 family protein [Bacteroidales bacterium]|nr:DUF935 family protein [Bacteroidales bacterium]